MGSSRVFVPAVGHEADGNILVRHPAERGSWIWHPDKAAHEAAVVLRFRLRFTLSESGSPIIHVTGDHRFQLRCDDRDVTFGPDRCDVEHWTVQTLKLELSAGEHEFEGLGLVHWRARWRNGAVESECGGLSHGRAASDGTKCRFALDFCFMRRGFSLRSASALGRRLGWLRTSPTR